MGSVDVEQGAGTAVHRGCGFLGCWSQQDAGCQGVHLPWGREVLGCAAVPGGGIWGGKTGRWRHMAAEPGRGLDGPRGERAQVEMGPYLVLGPRAVLAPKDSMRMELY